MTQTGNTATPAVTPTVHAAVPTTATTDTGGGLAIRLVQGVRVTNLGLVALQALSVGSILSGDPRAATVHGAGAMALQLGAFVQAATQLALG